MGAKPNIIALTRLPPRRTASMIEEEMPFWSNMARFLLQW
jgi:hypothetical protein